MELDEKRLQRAAESEQREAEFSLKKRELELAHLEAITNRDLKLEEAREDLRERRRKNAAKAREVAAQRRQQGTLGLPPWRGGGVEMGDCRMCHGDFTGVTADEVLAHRTHIGGAPPGVNGNG
jgi:hypothetical protein